MSYRVKTNYDRGYVNAMDKVRVFIESNQKVIGREKLANGRIPLEYRLWFISAIAEMRKCQITIY